MKLSIALNPDTDSTLQLIRRMGVAQKFRESDEIQYIELPCGSVAYTPGTHRASRLRLLRRNGGNMLVFAGVPISVEGPLDQRLDRIAAQDFSAAVKELSALDGAFVAVLWDESSGRLAIVTDFVGLQPLYLTESNGHLLFSSDIKAIMATGMVALEPDTAGWGAFIATGHWLGDHTSVSGIRRAAPGSVYVYDMAQRRLEHSSYWRYPEPKPLNRIEQVDTDAIANTLRATIAAYGEHSREGTVPLSGGFDSRLILTIVQEMGFPTRIVTMDHPDESLNMDGRLARRVARRFGIVPECHMPVRNHYGSEEYVDYVVLNEVSTPSLYLYIAQLSAYLKPDMTAIWEGLVPGAIITPPGGAHGGDFAELMRVKCRLEDHTLWQAARLLFRESFAGELYQSFLDIFRQESSRYSDDGFGTSEFIVRNRMRNRTGQNPVKVYSAHVLTFNPGLSRAFFEAAAGIPYELRMRHKIYNELYRRHFPSTGRIPFLSANTLHPGLSRFDMQYQITKVRLSKPYRRYSWAIQSRLGREDRWVWWDESHVIRRILDLMPPDDPYLNPDTIQAARRGDYPEGLYYQIKALLFYWQMWKWIMAGELSTRPSTLRDSLGLFSLNAHQGISTAA